MRESQENNPKQTPAQQAEHDITARRHSKTFQEKNPSRESR
jgi:hypothetical protein